MANKSIFIALFITIVVSSFASSYILVKVDLNDYLGVDQSVQEMMTVDISNNTNGNITLSLPENSEDVFLWDIAAEMQNNSIQIPLNCTECQINITYSLKGAVKREDKKTDSFSRTLNFPKPAREVDYSVHIPPGHIIELYADDPSIVPSATKIETDGKSIIIRWVEKKPEFPKRYFVKYSNFEQLQLDATDIKQELNEPAVWFLMGVSAVAGIVAGLLLYNKISKKIVRILPHVPSSLLNPDEKKIISLLKEQGNIMGQKDIVKNLDWSKSKVSAIVTNLEYKKIVNRERLGRNYKVKLIKEIHEE